MSGKLQAQAQTTEWFLLSSIGIWAACWQGFDPKNFPIGSVYIWLASTWIKLCWPILSSPSSCILHIFRGLKNIPPFTRTCNETMYAIVSVIYLQNTQIKISKCLIFIHVKYPHRILTCFLCLKQSVKFHIKNETLSLQTYHVSNIWLDLRKVKVY